MSQQLINHLKKYVAIDATEASEILSFFELKNFSKKENLVEQDSKCKYHYFVAKGCLRLFFINDKGMEQTIQFALENWWMTDYRSFDQQTTTDFTIQAVEKTEVFQIDYLNQEKLLLKFPKLERYFRLIYQRAYSASQFRIKYLYDLSREENYHHFNDSFPEFSKRIPQHLLASYLNMTPEYLSEIKKKSQS